MKREVMSASWDKVDESEGEEDFNEENEPLSSLALFNEVKFKFQQLYLPN